ncbi:MAG: ribonuclease H-like domain-containing protein [Candidatus Hydrogenedentes bacterium]|nr:ribonuclease H-like domain-containing protein [Candidatus Hydrogenedentota bacterium]
MSDVKKKLDSLMKQHQLQTGAEWERVRAERPAPERRAAPISSEGPEETPQPQRLRELLDRLAMIPASESYRRREEEELRRESGALDVQQVIGGEIIGDDDSAFLLLRRDYPIEHRQGKVALGTALETASHHIAFSACDPSLGDFDPRKTLFVDTETIGLSGGTGTIAFLVGMGYFTESAFRLDQCFLRDYDDEAAMLRCVAELVGRHEALVSYNGKSFDLPLLRTRFIQNRIPFRADAILHLDLVHVARRFWKRRLADCSLGNIEREILGVQRQGDVPSFLIPQLWFEYLRSRDARPLEGVFYHHRMDILSLAALTGWVSQCLEAPAGDGFHYQEDRLSVVRVYFQQRRYQEVLEHGERFLELEAASPLRQECLEMLGLACKRLHAWEKMERVWEQLAAEFPRTLIAYLELAKHYEHRCRDLLRAEAVCRRALEHLQEESGVRAVYSLQDPEPLHRRLDRIRRKLGKVTGLSGEDLL